MATTWVYRVPTARYEGHAWYVFDVLPSYLAVCVGIAPPRVTRSCVRGEHCFRCSLIGVQPNPWSSAGGKGGGCFEPKQREQERQLGAKVGAQDSSMRLLRADVTTLRKRLRRQGEILAKQIEENEVVRHSAEQVYI